MTGTAFDPGPAATTLAATWRDGGRLTDLSKVIRPRLLSEGYDVQDRLVAEIGDSVAGWKIGRASRSAKREYGADSPIFGRILTPRLYRHGDVVKVPIAARITVEFEAALVLARDIDANTRIDEIDFSTAIAATHAGFELVSSRFADRDRLDSALVVADNSFSFAVVFGDPIDLGSLDEIAKDVVVKVDERVGARGLTGDDLPDLAGGWQSLITHTIGRGTALRSGDVVFSGTLTAPFDLDSSSSELSARYFRCELSCRISRK